MEWNLKLESAICEFAVIANIDQTFKYVDLNPVFNYDLYANIKW